MNKQNATELYTLIVCGVNFNLNKRLFIGVNKGVIDGVETKVLMQHIGRLNGPMGTLLVPQQERALNKSALFSLVWKNF